MRFAIHQSISDKKFRQLLLYLLGCSLLVTYQAAPAQVSLSSGGKPDTGFQVITENAPIKNRLDTDRLRKKSTRNGFLMAQGCRGEIRPLTLTIAANKSLKNLAIRAADLTGIGATIPSSSVDIRLVKWWYQGGGDNRAKQSRVYTPELLLKDSELIRVDTSSKSNYLRSTQADGTEHYLLCSGPTSNNLDSVRPQDAATLQPISLKQGEEQEFWVNIHIPEDTAAGAYEGFLTVTVDGVDAKTIPLQVHVYPFALKPSPLIYSIYYRAKLSADDTATIGSELKSREQYRAEIMNMKAHGVVYPTNYQPSGQLLQEILQIRREANLPTNLFFTLAYKKTVSEDPQKLRALQKNIREWIELLRNHDYEDIYFYGIDEARGKRLLSQKATWKAIHEAGGKVFTASNKTNSKEIDRTIKHMGDLLDAPIIHGKPVASYAKKWHKKGAKVFSYANPQVGEEDPEKYRRNYGLLLYKNRYDGAMDYAYQHGFTHIWNDFDHHKYRDLVFTYPTINGVVDTIAWEGFREATYDVRYAATLQNAIDRAIDKKHALLAQKWLDSLDPESVDLNQTRKAMADWISKLSQE